MAAPVTEWKCQALRFEFRRTRSPSPEITGLHPSLTTCFALFNSPLLIIVIRSCSRCIGRGVVLALDSSSEPLLSPVPVFSTTLNKAHATTPEIRLLSSNQTSTSYRAFRTILACEAYPPPTYDWLDISPSYNSPATAAGLARANCPAKLPHPYWHTTIESSSQRRRPLSG